VVDDEIGARGVIGESMNKRLRTMESEIESFWKKKQRNLSEIRAFRNEKTENESFFCFGG
jgi:hypothetical protein